MAVRRGESAARATARGVRSMAARARRRSSTSTRPRAPRARNGKTHGGGIAPCSPSRARAGVRRRSAPTRDAHRRGEGRATPRAATSLRLRRQPGGRRSRARQTPRRCRPARARPFVGRVARLRRLDAQNSPVLRVARRTDAPAPPAERQASRPSPRAPRARPHSCRIRRCSRVDATAAHARRERPPQLSRDAEMAVRNMASK